MKHIKFTLPELDWQHIEDNLNDDGYVLIKNYLPQQEIQRLIDSFDDSNGYRKHVVMERHNFGKGTYKYWKYPLPELITRLREDLYTPLSKIANRWMKLLNTDKAFPSTYKELQKQCSDNNQNLPTSLILQYEQGGYNTLHQDLYGEVYFPIQGACFLSEPCTDYLGGEFVITQHQPRSQTKAIVITPNKGDLLLFPTNFRPVKSARGYSRATMRHGVSEVKKGKRYAMGIIFHDAEK